MRPGGSRAPGRGSEAGRRRAPTVAWVVALVPMAAAVFDPGEVRAQEHAVAFEGSFLGYTFDDEFPLDAVNLFIAPFGYRVPVGRNLVLDFSGAWAQGRVEAGDRTYELQGLVDSQVKARLQATPWALLSVSVNLPTGEATHDTDEAVVASVLSSDLLGFRESVWGVGLGVTTAVSAATRAGDWGLGAGASYRVAGGFQPADGSELEYEPGNELRLRVGLDRDLGASGTLTLGATFQSFAEDRADGRNLFQAGSRFMGDANLVFRAGSQIWTLHAANVWRERGDLTFTLVDGSGAVVADTVVHTPSQNLVIAGLSGSIPMGGAHRFRPALDVRRQTRDNPSGDDEGSGWIAGAGADLLLRLGPRTTLVPSGRFLTGSVVDPDDEARGVTGVEGGVILRFQLGQLGG